MSKKGTAPVTQTGAVRGFRFLVSSHSNAGTKVRCHDDQPPKNHFGELRESGVRGVLVYCADYKCTHWVKIDAGRWPDDVRLSDLEPKFTCRACGRRVRISGQTLTKHLGQAGAQDRSDEVRHPRPYSDPEKAARKLLEIANSVEAVQDGSIHIEKINGPFLKAGGSPAEYGAGLSFAIERGWLWKHESGTYLKFTPVGAELFA